MKQMTERWKEGHVLNESEREKERQKERVNDNVMKKDKEVKIH